MFPFEENIAFINFNVGITTGNLDDVKELQQTIEESHEKK